MSETVRKTLAILNLTGELSVELVEYFNARKVTVIDPLKGSQTLDWTHILTKDIHDFDIIRETYQTLEKDVKVISLSAVNDLQNFIYANGKLIFDELWLKSNLGSFILDKFLQEYGGISLGESYPSFKELGSFQVVNPFNTSEYLDRMTYHAFEHDADALSMKTSFDHLLMFLTGLKNRKKIGFPIEITYGTYNDVFGIQLHFFAQNVMLDDVTSCLSSSITKKAEEYLLNVAIQSTDFFDFTFLQEVRKAVITILWTRDRRIKYENKGLMFSNLSSTAQITAYSTEGVSSSFLVQDPKIEDVSDKIVLPAKAETVNDETKISVQKFSEALAERISSSMELEKIKQIISGDFNEKEFSQLVKGTEDISDVAQVVKGSKDNEDDLKILIGSQDTMDDILNLVKGKVEEEKNSIFLIPGNKFDPDKFAYNITSGLNERIKGDNVLKTKILQKQLPQTIKKGLFDFAVKLNKEIENLSSSDLDSFKNFEMPKLIKQHTEIDENNVYGVLTKDGQFQAKKFFENFKNSFQEILKSEFQEDSISNVLDSIKSETDSLKVKGVLKDTLKKSLDEKFHLSEKNCISENDQEILVKALTTSLSEDEEKIRTMIHEEKVENIENEVVSLFGSDKSLNEIRLEQQVKTLTIDKDKLKEKVRALLSQVSLSKNVNDKLNEINKKAQKDAEAHLANTLPDADELLREKFKNQLQEQKKVSEHDALKLASLLERETKLITEIRQEEMRFKKLQLEGNQKEAYFIQEVEKSQRLLKAKDMVIEKSKGVLAKLTEKKDYEIKDLQQKLDQLSKALAGGQQHNQVTIIRDLERQNANMTKMLDVYRNKLTSLASNIERQSTKSDDSHLKDEVRKLQNLNNQYRNQVETFKKEAARYKEKSDQEGHFAAGLRQEKMKLEQQLKKAIQESQHPGSGPLGPVINDQEYRRLQSEAQILETQLRDSLQKNKDLETKIQESQKTQRPSSAADDPSKVKVLQLENSVKKLTQDLVDSRNQLAEMKKETNKLRQEKTAIQNQLDKLKKDMDKSKGAAPKKPVGGKAA